MPPTRPAPRKKILVAIFQRGAVDGLNVVVPFGEKALLRAAADHRDPAARRHAGCAIDLDGFFGLHPALAPLKPIYDAGQLAIVHAVGSPDPTRSHFDAQDYMESGTPGRKATSDGWLNRALRWRARQILAGARGQPGRGAAACDARPQRSRGDQQSERFPGAGRSAVRCGFESMYENSLDKVLNGTGRETFEAVKLMQSIQKQAYAPANGAKYPNGRLGQSLMQIARLIKSNVGLEVAFTDVGGWDTHVNEVGAKPAQGQLANLLGNFGEALAAFYTTWVTAWPM